MSRHRYVPRVESLESRDLLRGPADAPLLGAPPAPAANVIWVDTVPELQSAVQNLQSNQTIVVQRGTYQLTRTLFIGKDSPVSNVTIRGETDNFNDVVIKGLGMDGAFDPQLAHGISIYNAQDVTIANLSVGDVYWHAIDLQGWAGAERVQMYHCRFFDAGEQIIKSNAGGDGVDDVVLEYCLIEYTNGPSVIDHGGGTGYTAALHAHETDRWRIRDNLFRNFHSPDSVSIWFSPVVLMWNNSSDTVIERNTFIDCDRAIALGLVERDDFYDHQGGVVRDNFIYQRPGLFSAIRRANSDAQILVFESPGTQVYHNTVLTNNNSRYSLEARFATAGVAFDNNLTDAPFSTRDGGTYTGSGNYLGATPAMFVNATAADLHLVDSAQTRASVIDRAVSRSGATNDYDGGSRPQGAAADVGADELQTSSNRPPVLQAVADRTIPATQQTVSVTLSATDADGDPLTYTATAQSLAYVLDQQYSLFSDGNYYENAWGRNEKWVQGSGTGWYFILPNGELYQWDGVLPAVNGTLLGNIGTSYYTDPIRLTSAPVNQPRATLNVSGSTLTITRDPSWVSALVVTATVNDGRGGADSKSFRVSVGAAAGNSPPVLAPLSDRTISSATASTNVTLSASDADGDPITYSATAQSLAYTLRIQYGLFSDGNDYFNAWGRNEKWVQGSGTGWYFILPNGELYQWHGGVPEAQGTLLGNVGTSYYNDLSRLVNAPAHQPRATLTVSGNVLTITRDTSWVSGLVVTVTASDGRGGTDSKTFAVTVTA